MLRVGVSWKATKITVMGKIVQIDGLDVLVQAITATHSVLENEHQYISVLTATILEQIADQ